MLEPITKPAPNGGHYSTIRFPDGMVETVLFDANDNTLATRRTFQGIRTIQEEHIESIEQKELRA